MNLYITGFSSCVNQFKSSFVCPDPESDDTAKLIIYRGSANDAQNGVTLEVHQTHEIDDDPENALCYVASAHLSRQNAVDLLLSLADKLDFRVITANQEITK
jgi:hypothetical protein